MSDSFFTCVLVTLVNPALHVCLVGFCNDYFDVPNEFFVIKHAAYKRYNSNALVFPQPLHSHLEGWAKTNKLIIFIKSIVVVKFDSCIFFTPKL